MPQGAIDYSSGGLKEPIYVAGIRYVRFQVTATSGSVEFRITVTGTTGDVLEVPTAVTTRGYYGVFTANADQSIGNATATAVLFDTTEEATGVSLGSPLSRVVVANAGEQAAALDLELAGHGGSATVLPIGDWRPDAGRSASWGDPGRLAVRVPARSGLVARLGH